MKMGLRGTKCRKGLVDLKGIYKIFGFEIVKIIVILGKLANTEVKEFVDEILSSKKIWK